MSKKHVHWWDGEVDGDDSDNNSFLPPSPNQVSPSASGADDDSLVDTPSPPTPLTTLEPVSSVSGAYQSRHWARRPSDTCIRSPEDSSWRFGESSPRYDAFNMSTMGRAIPHPREQGSLPHKSSDATLFRQPRLEAPRSPSLPG